MPMRRSGKPTVLSASILAAAVAVLFAISPDTRAADTSPSIIFSDATDGRYILGLHKGFGEATARNIAAELGLQSGRWIRSGRALQVRPITPENAEDVRLALESDDRVRYLEPDWVIDALFTPNDTRYGQQWGPPHIDLEEAWDDTTGNGNVVVAIVDTGIHKTHADISGKVVAHEYDYHNGDSDASDDHGHGTHVGGIVGAQFHNSRGVAAIGGDTKLMAMKVLGSGGSGSASNVASGIEDAADHDADIINLSLGSTSQSTAIQDAVNHAYDEGVLVVSASGNNGNSTPVYPAAYTASMAIGAVNSSDQRASFSSYGSWLDMVAPGVRIHSTWCCQGGAQYVDASGTSMAAPYVAGVAALLLDVDSTLTHDQVWDILLETAVDVGPSGPDIYTGDGRLEADAAVQEAGAATPTPTNTPSPTPTPTPTPVTQTFATTADAFVLEIEPDTNFGSDTVLHAGSPPEMNSYLKFDVQGTGATILDATLRLYTVAGSSTGVDGHEVTDDSWTEGGITFNNAPNIGAVAGSSGSFSSGEWIEIDVTSAIDGDGTASIALTSADKPAAFESREGARSPELLVVSQGGSGPTSTPLPPSATPADTPSSTPSPSPTNTATPLPSATPTPLPTATWTPLPTLTPTPLPTATWTPSPTPTALPTATPTVTPLPTATWTPLPTATQTPSPTVTPLPTATSTPSPTLTPLPTATWTPLPTATETPEPTSTPEPSSTPVPTSTPSVFEASADAMVSQSDPDRNYGDKEFLITFDNPEHLGYLRFDVTGLSGSVQSATLRIYAWAGAGSGIDARGVSGSWGESTITYNNAPAPGAVEGSSGGFGAGWVEIDVSSLVSGNGSVDMAITAAGSEFLEFASREDTAHVPELHVVTD